jgi:RNA polymerase sigma-70 factor, ECF subfamily
MSDLASLPAPLNSTLAASPVADTEAEFEHALNAIIEPAYRLGLRLTGNQQDAEDLVQEAALRAYRFRATFAHGTSFKAWFYRIQLNCLYTQSRRRRPESAIDDLEDAHDLYLYSKSAEAGVIGPDSDPLAGTVSRMTSEQVALALEALPDEFRTVCTMYLMDDLSYQEIATALGVPTGTVRSRLHRGRKMLQKRLWDAARDLGLVSTSSEEPS